MYSAMHIPEPIQRHCYVFFATARRARRRKLPLRRRCRIACKFRRRTYFAFLSWLVRTLTRSQLAHCSIGYDGAVLDPGIRRNTYWPFRAYVISYPTLVCCFRVLVSRPIDLDAFPQGSKPAWPTFVRWLTRGRWPWTTDCVCIAIDCLRQGGIAVPRQLVSPQQLHDWLLERYERTVFA